MEKEAILFSCDICQKTFNQKKCLRRHIISHQNSVSEKEKTQIKCIECSTKFRTRRHLLIHYINDHGKNIIEETESFSSQSEFKDWKRELELKDQCHFVSTRGVKKCTDGAKKWYLRCHRDGFFKSSVNPRKKKLKSQGSNKIYGSCTAQMIVNEDINGAITVRYIREHVNHSSNNGRLNLTKEERASIAERISEGVPFDEILNRIRDSVDDVGKSNVLAYLTKQDLRNIERDFNLYSGHEPVNDFISVQLWYEKVSHLPANVNPVVYFKPQGIDSCEKNSLKSEDILLVIAAEFQISMLKQFGSNIICINSTHGTNTYDFHLTSIVVVDEFGNNIPVAFCISNKKDTSTWAIFFEKLKEHVGVINARVFMSDIDDSFYNAWVIVMAPATMRLLWVRHVDCAWRTNLLALVKNKEKRALVYKGLRVVLKEPEVDNFHLLLDSFLKQTQEDDETAEFGSYFQKFYVKRVKEWAYCYRKFSKINTNMYMESLHKEFKYCYLQGRKNKRLDKAIDALLKLARDQIYKRMRKISKNKCPKKEEAIRDSHQEAVTSLKTVKIQQVSSSVWTVSSFSNENIVYEVTKMPENSKICSDSNECLQTCDICAICIHSYSCDCVDYSIKENICKHIHSCVMTYSPLNDGIENIMIYEPLDEDVEIIMEYESLDEDVENEMEYEPEPVIYSFNTLLPVKNQSTVKNDDLFQSVLTKAEAVVGYLSDRQKEDFSDEQLRTLVSYLNRALDIVTLLPNKSKENREPSHEKVERQIRFESTKKKRLPVSSHNLSAPSVQEKRYIFEGLLNTEVENIPLDFDHNY